MAIIAHLAFTQRKSIPALLALSVAVLLSHPSALAAGEQRTSVSDSEIGVGVDPENAWSFGVVLVERLGVQEIDGKKMPRRISREHEQYLQYGGGTDKEYSLIQVGEGEHTFKVRYMESHVEEHLFSKDKKVTEYAASLQEFKFHVGAGKYYMMSGVKSSPGWSVEFKESPFPVRYGRRDKYSNVWLQTDPADERGCDYIARTRFLWAADRGDVERVRQLLDGGLRPRSLEPDPLFRAVGARENRKKLIELLVSAGADPNSRDQHQNTPLHRAAGYVDHEQTVDAVRALIAAGADLNARDKDKETPVMRLCRYGKAEAAELLLQTGARLSSSEADEMLFPAARNNARKVVELLVRHGAEMDVFIAAYVGDTEYLKQAASKKPRIVHSTLDKEYYEGLSPIHLAASNGHIETVDFLLAQGVDVNAKDKLGGTPLHGAAGNLQAEMVKHLVSKGADIKAEKQVLNNITMNPLDVVRRASTEGKDGEAKKVAQTAIIEFLEHQGTRGAE